MAADTIPSSSTCNIDRVNSPKSPFKTFTDALRGEEETVTSQLMCRSQDETVVAPAEADDDNAAIFPKKSAWSKPAPENGDLGASLVMGVTWPSISESTRHSSKPKSSFHSSKPVPACDDGSTSSSQGPVISHAPQKQSNARGNLNFTPNNRKPVRQKSMKRGDGSGQSGFSRPQPPPPQLPPPFPVPFGNMLPPPPMMELPIGEPPFNGNHLEIRPVGGVEGNDRSSQRHSSRRGNFGPRPRGDGGHHNGYGGRRDQNRGWNGPGNPMGPPPRPPPPPPPPPPRGFRAPPPPGPTPFIQGPYARPFANPMMAFDMVPPFYGPPLPSPESFPVPFVPRPPLPPMFIPFMDPNLRILLLNQIEYYFSDDNLVKDTFLRSNMDDQGWVPISLIASFRRVLHLTNNIQFILDTVGASTVVEVQGDKLRRRDNWRKWIPPTPSARVQLPPETDHGLKSPSESPDNVLATSIQKIRLDEDKVATNQTSTTTDMEGADSEVMNAQSKSANGLNTAEAASSSRI